jgi:hypothetical protein
MFAVHLIWICNFWVIQNIQQKNLLWSYFHEQIWKYKWIAKWRIHEEHDLSSEVWVWIPAADVAHWLSRICHILCFLWETGWMSSCVVYKQITAALHQSNLILKFLPFCHFSFLTLGACLSPDCEWEEFGTKSICWTQAKCLKASCLPFAIYTPVTKDNVVRVCNQHKRTGDECLNGRIWAHHHHVKIETSGCSF